MHANITVAEKDNVVAARPRMGRALAAAASIEGRRGKPAIVSIAASQASTSRM